MAEVASRLGVTTHSLHQWIKRYRVPPPEPEVAQEQEMRTLKQKQLDGQQFHSTNNQQNMARYLELEQKCRAKLEQELGKIKR